MLIDFASSKVFSKEMKIRVEFFGFGKGGVLVLKVEVGLLAGNALWAILLLSSSCFTGVGLFLQVSYFSLA